MPIEIADTSDTSEEQLVRQRRTWQLYFQPWARDVNNHTERDTPPIEPLETSKDSGTTWRIY